MVAGSITEEYAVSVSVERLWKVAFAGDQFALPKVCPGFIDAVDIQGGGGPGSVTTLKINPAAGVPVAAFKSRLVVRDAAARVVRSEVLEGGRLSAQLKSQVAEVRLVPAGEAACVAKVTVEYESVDGAAALPEEDLAKLPQGYLGLIKKVEAYLVAHPDEFA